MEDKLGNLQVLRQFQNKQVVINYYEKDELVRREGFFFINIEMKEGSIHFIREKNKDFILSIHDDFQFTQQSEFKHYYFLENTDERVELYFP
ncbi:hypothetical protein J2Z40_000229 [Cytobacillus eiseniae]|uniref:AraC family transcriptional regulator n=1 Tax=Cytobacillus eiseniae TaxID=762947 RepID=A0ABS4R9W8_9BACI|nr:hypothetical protein [Cytobacillus eiseniae]MBP2239676.1 hypothetical protein [Cytobacillus eiseniae]